MKKFFMLMILATIAAFITVNAQNVSVTVNSIDLKYEGIDAAKWCPPGSIVSADFPSRSVTVIKDNVETFRAVLKNAKKVNGYWTFTGVVSDKQIKNAKVSLTFISVSKAKLKVTLPSGEVYRRTLTL